jgi:phosphoribosyl 1,2-cyclic phosphodiesterase
VTDVHLDSDVEHIDVRRGLKVEFWGVRGSIATPENDKLRLGGNTPCVVLQYADEPPVIIDAGTGLRHFGAHLKTSGGEPFLASILFSHFHWDHIQGLPFFPPLYSDESELDVYAGVAVDVLRAVLEGQMGEPYFPVPFAAARSRRRYRQMQGQGCEIGSLRVKPVPLNHPGGATGYRIDSPNGSVIYVSDHEHGISEIDDRIAIDAYAADVVIYDAHFTPEEYPKFVGWGHSTWLEGTRLAHRANVGRLLLFHHSPSRADNAADAILEQARHKFSATDLASENYEIVLCSGVQTVTPVSALP